MKKRIIIIIFMLLGSVEIFSQAVQLNNFTELMDALTTGEEIRVIIHYGDCELIINGEKKEAPEAIGGMNFTTFEYFAAGTVRNDKAFVTSSETVLIGHPYYGYVYNYAKVRVYEDQSVEIIARYLDPNTYEVKMDETFKTNMNNGENKAAAYFYQN